MPSLAVFDFDRTIVEDDSDATIIRELTQKQEPPEFDSSTNDWTPYMSDVFEHAFTAGLSEQDILSAIAAMRPTSGMETLLSSLSHQGWEVIVVSDANSVFVEHWLGVHQLDQAVKSVITNRAFFQNGRLFIEPCMRQNACQFCPPNLCKSLAIAKWCASRDTYDRIVYTGDGRNDFCPSIVLPSESTIFPRKGYPLHKLLQKEAESTNSRLKAKVVPWEDCYTIINELMPKTC